MKNINDIDIQLLTDYEKGSLSKEQSEEVKKRLETDMEFIKLFDNLGTLIPLIKKYFTQQEKTDQSPIRRYLRELEKSLPEVGDEIENKETAPLNNPEFINKKKRKIISLFRINYLIPAAASIAIVIAIGILFENSRISSSNQIFETYYKIILRITKEIMLT